MGYETDLIATYHQAHKRLTNPPEPAKPFHHPEPFDHEPIQIWVPSLAFIIKMVALHEQTSIVEIRSHRRNKKACEARMIIYYLARHFTTMTTPGIGYHLGGRDHTTIITGARRIEGRRLTDYKLDQKLRKYEDLLNARPKAS